MLPHFEVFSRACSFWFISCRCKVFPIHFYMSVILFSGLLARSKPSQASFISALFTHDWRSASGTF
jgi:hypothetical protein